MAAVRAGLRVVDQPQPLVGAAGVGAASRPALASVTEKPVSTMPSGSKTVAWRYSSKRRPEITSTRRAHTSVDHEYSQRVPGWKRSGSPPRRSTSVASVPRRGGAWRGGRGCWRGSSRALAGP